MDELISEFAQGVTVVTPDQALARHVTARYNMRLQASGARAWESPDIVSWSGWISRNWQSQCESGGVNPDMPLLLSDAQELALWEQVIEASATVREEDQLLPVSTTARAARDAWHTLHGWCRTLRHCRQPLSEDEAAFVAWATAFQGRCRRSGWIDKAQATQRLIGQANGSPPPPVPAEVILLGFNELTPQQHALVQRYRDAGVKCTPRAPQVGCSSAVRIAARNTDEEFQLAARWACELLRYGHAGPVGVVVREIEMSRARIEQSFHQMLEPYPGTDQLSGPAFNLSVGQPLTAAPVIAAALRLLQLAAAPTPLATIGSVLRSPFITGWDSELGRRALLDERLRRDGGHRLYLDALRYWAGGGGRAGQVPWICPQLVDALERAATLLPERHSTRHCGGWARFFCDWLNAFGWPGERALERAEAEALSAWHSLLSEFVGIELVAGSSTLPSALRRLTNMASQRRVRSTELTAPVQIVRMSEATGLTFSHLWITGMSDKDWPAAPRPTPFLPLSLQRSSDMPHCNAAWELRTAQALTKCLLACGVEIVVSSPATHEELSVGPSHLVSDVPEVAVESLKLSQPPPTMRWMQAHRPTLVELIDDVGPPCSAGAVPGGVGIFRDQAACAFRAFARHRLGAEELTFPGPGLDAAARGKLLHSALEKVWRALGSQKALIGLDDTERVRLVDKQVSQALRVLIEDDRSRFARRFIDLERRRLTALILEWFQHDLDRPVFQVEESELDTLANIAGLPVRIRPDRVDRLSDGKRLVIDYKTGRADIGDWFGERPQDPQLPVYLLGLGSDITAVAYGQVRKGEVGLHGLAEAADVAPGVTPVSRSRLGRSVDGWSALVGEWRGVIQRLAIDYLAGRAQVDPKSTSVCRNCHIRPLCRVSETHSVTTHRDVSDA